MKAVIVVLMFSISASAQELPTARTPQFDAFYNSISRPALYACAAFDYGTTRAAIRSGYAVEANPLLGQGAARQAVFVFGPAIGLDLLSHFLAKRGKPKLAGSLRLGAGAVHCVGGFKNLSQMDALRNGTN